MNYFSNRTEKGAGEPGVRRHVIAAAGATLLALILTLAGCSGPLDAPKGDNGAGNGNTGLGRVAITIGGEGIIPAAQTAQSARTLYPTAAQFGTYELSFSGPEPKAAAAFVPGTQQTVELAPGSWTITAKAYKSGVPTVVAAIGSSGALNIAPGANSPVAITLEPYAGGDAVQGTFSYDVTIPGGLTSATVTVTTPTGGAVTGGTENLNLTAGQKTGIINLDGGYYLVKVSLVKGALSAGKTEVAHIYPGLTTPAPAWIFTDADLKPALMGTVNLTGTATFGQILTATSTLEGSGGLTYVWKRDGTAIRTEGPTAAATDTYTLAAADIGGIITVEVSRAGYDGEKTSNASGTVAAIGISSASISGLVAPVVGGTPGVDTSLAVPGGAEYTVQSIAWKQGASAHSGAFAAVKVYNATIVLKANAGYQFTGSIAPATNLAAVANPVSGVVVGAGDSENTLTFVVTFPATGKAAGGTVTAPGGSTSGTSITATAVSVSGNAEQTPEYAVDTSSSAAPANGWQTTLGFSGLNAGTTYYVWARAKESTTYLTGTAVKSAAILVGQEIVDANAFRTAHSTVLGKTTVTVTTGDETAVNAALTAYGLLSNAAKALVATEKALLDDLKVKIDELNAVSHAASFTSTHSAVLAKNTGTITTADETAVSAALTAYGLLSNAAKALVATEKTLLDNLKSTIDGYKSAAAAFQSTHSAVLALTDVTVDTTDQGIVTAARSAYDALDAKVTVLLGTEDTLLTTLQNKITALNNAASSFQSTHSTVLALTDTTVASGNQGIVTAARSAYDLLDTRVKALLGAEDTLLTSLQTKITALNNAASSFQSTHSTVLALTDTTVDTTDQGIVTAARSAYDLLDARVKALLGTEDTLLTTLQTKITALNTAAAAFQSTYSVVLALTVNTVSATDEAAVDTAITAWNNLSDARVKALLTAEKTLLDSLKTKIAERKGPLIAITAGQMTDTAFTIANQTLYRGNPTATRTATFTLAPGYSNIKWSVGSAELAWANGLTAFTFDPADWPAGTYTLGVTVETGGKSWSKNVTITVVNGTN